MKILQSILLALALSLTAVSCRAQSEKLGAATLAVYKGKQVCKWTPEPNMFGLLDYEWGCKFESRFTCTATVVASDDRGHYGGLTAGHCFDWDSDYYVAEQIANEPVMHKITLEKFENDDRYDFAIFTFTSSKKYPVIEIDMDGDAPKIGTKIWNVNFSLGLTKQFVDAQVVSDIITEPIPRLADTKGRYLVSIGIGPGASGSAVIDSSGKIVGLVEAVFMGTQMPTVVMPTGKTFSNFIEDDSAGLKPEKEKGKPPVPEDKPEPTKKKRFKLF